MLQLAHNALPMCDNRCNRPGCIFGADYLLFIPTLFLASPISMWLGVSPLASIQHSLKERESSGWSLGTNSASFMTGSRLLMPHAVVFLYSAHRLGAVNANREATGMMNELVTSMLAVILRYGSRLRTKRGERLGSCNRLPAVPFWHAACL